MAEETKVDETKVEGQQTDEGAAANPAGAGSDEKKYSDKEVNDISTKNVAKAEQKLLKSLGITDVEKAKGILKAVADVEAKENDTDAIRLRALSTV